MTKHEIGDLKEIKSLRLGRKGELPMVEIRLLMVLTGIKLDQQNNVILELTDFTSAYKTNLIQCEVKKSDISIMSEIQDILKTYNLEPSGLLQKRYYPIMDKNIVIILNILSHVYNGAVDYGFNLIELEVVNKDPMKVLKLPLKHQLKFKSLIQGLKKRIKTITNKEEFENLSSISSRNVSNEVEGPEDKNSDENEIDNLRVFKRPKLDQHPIRVNPLFVPPISTSSQVPLLSQFNSQLLSDTYQEDDDSIESIEESIDETGEDGIPNELSQDATQRLTDREKYDNTTTDDLDTSIRVKKEPSLNDETSSNIPNLTENAINEQHNSTGIETHTEIDTHTQTDNTSTPFNSESSIEIEENPNAIGIHLRKTSITPGVELRFNGYIIGIEPLNFPLISKSFQDLNRPINFRIIISNIPRDQLKVFQINKNCLALEFKSKQRIYEFLNINDDDDITEDNNLINKVNETFKQLINETRPFSFRIIRKKIHLSIGEQLIWECQNKIDDLISQKNSH